MFRIIFKCMSNFVITQDSELQMAQQLLGDVLPIHDPGMIKAIKARKITDEERNVCVFKSMRMARANKRLLGIREKRAKEKAEEAALKKK